MGEQRYTNAFRFTAFYDNQGHLLAVSPIWQASDYQQPTTPLTHGGAVSHATAVTMHVSLMTALDEGWLAFDTIKVTSLSDPITAQPDQYHKLTAQVSGQLSSANGGRLFVKYSNGTIGYEWQNTAVFNGSQNVSGNFTTPSGVSSFQVGTEVVLDKGYLAFSSVVLRALSDPIAVTAGDGYQFDGQVAGSLVAPVGQGGQIVARYSNAAGGDAGYDVLWDNSANFNGTAQVQQTFNANPGATTMRLMLITNLDAGHLTYSNFGLQHMVTSYSTIQRTTYSVAGQSVGVKVAGDPDNGNNGLFFLYSDHLGSTSAMRHPDGSVTQTKYLPFGGYRSGGSNPITDRGFTDHKHNDSLGLIYMNARYYVVGISRFASADTLVPDPTNPQQFNRYTYSLNNPLTFRDPTGHISCTDSNLPGDDQQDCLATPPTFPPPKEIKSGVPAVIQNATPFDTLPFNSTAYLTGRGVQGFGDTLYAFEHQGSYGLFGRLHPGVDIPMNPGTQLLALGDGYVTCGTLSDQDNFCGQTSESGGYGIGIYYYDCDCIVYYSHATDVLPQFTNGENTPVKAGQVVGLSSASRFVKADGTIGTYAHLHLEVRNVANTIVYNPIYFFTPSAWSSMNLTYMPYHNNYANPQTRMYAIQMQDGYNYWHGPYPLVWVR